MDKVIIFDLEAKIAQGSTQKPVVGHHVIWDYTGG